MRPSQENELLIQVRGRKNPGRTAWFLAWEMVKEQALNSTLLLRCSRWRVGNNGREEGMDSIPVNTGLRTDVRPVWGQSGFQKGGNHAVTVGEGEDLLGGRVVGG